MSSHKQPWFFLAMSFLLCLSNLVHTMEKRKKRKPRQTRLYIVAHEAYTKGFKHEATSLRDAVQAHHMPTVRSLLNQIEPGTDTITIDGMNMRLLAHYLIAQNKHEEADEIIKAFENDNFGLVTALVLKHLINNPCLAMKANAAYDAVKNNNCVSQRSLIYDGMASSTMLSVIGNEALYEEKFELADWLFEHGVTFLNKRIYPLSLPSLLWAYQHGINLKADARQIRRMPLLINAVMSDSGGLLKLALLDSTTEVPIKLFSALAIAIAFGKHEFVQEIVKSYGDKLSNELKELAIIRSAACGQLAILLFLLNNFGFMQPLVLRDAFLVAASRGHLPIIKLLLKKYSTETEEYIDLAFTYAVLSNKHSVASYLLKSANIKPEMRGSWQDTFELALYYAGAYERWGLFCWILEEALSRDFSLNALRKYFRFLLKKQKEQTNPTLVRRLTFMLGLLDSENIEESKLFGHLFLMPRDQIHTILLRYLNSIPNQQAVDSRALPTSL